MRQILTSGRDPVGPAHDHALGQQKLEWFADRDQTDAFHEMHEKPCVIQMKNSWTRKINRSRSETVRFLKQTRDHAPFHQHKRPRASFAHWLHVKRQIFRFVDQGSVKNTMTNRKTCPKFQSPAGPPKSTEGIGTWPNYPWRPRRTDQGSNGRLLAESRVNPIQAQVRP